MSKIRDASTDQPLPRGTGAIIGNLVRSDIEKRMELGRRKYGEYLRAFNGRSWKIDLYEELLDAVCYLRQGIEEQRAIERRKEQQPLETFNP